MDNFNFSPTPVQPQTPAVNPVAAPAPVPPMSMPDHKADHNNLIKTILIVVISILALIFLTLFVWMTINWRDAKTDVDGQIKKAVAVAVNEKETELETAFAEKEKYPFSTFAGPADYGELTFEYPKTWSVYVAESASKKGDFVAYFNPGQVNPVSDETVMSLRVKINDANTEEVLTEYNEETEEGTLKASTHIVNGVSANLFEGTLSSGLKGIVAVFKIRDKTVTLQTDALQFKADFIRILDTVKYKK